MYEVIEHTADVGLRIRAADLETLFVEAAQGLFSLIVPDLAAVRTTDSIYFELQGEISELLLFDWLNELLFTYETQHLLLAQFEVKFGKFGMRATAQGEALNHERHALDHEVKAITYHGLKLEKQTDHWLAEVILDI